MPNLAGRLRALWARRPGRAAAARDDLARRVEALERSLRALTDAAAQPAPPPPALPPPAPPPFPDSPPRRDRPGWLDLAGALTILGLVLYGAVAFSYVTFFGAFDVSLEEVGLGYATLLRRSGLNLAVVVASLTAAAALLSFFGDRRAGHRRAAYLTAAGVLAMMAVGGFVWLLAGFGAIEEAGIYSQACVSMAVLLGMRGVLGPISPPPGWSREVRETWEMVRHPPTPAARRSRNIGLGVIAGALLLGIPLFALAWLSQDGLGSPLTAIAIVAAGLMLAVWGPAGLQRARQALLPPPVPAALPVVALLVVAVVLAGAAHGARAAERVKGLGDLRQQGGLGRLVLEVSTPRVCVSWVGAVPAPATLPQHELLYLGQADSILALYDASTGQPIRVSSGNVVLVELTAAERATRALSTCRQTGR